MQPTEHPYGKYKVDCKEKDLSIAKLCLKYLEFEDFHGTHWTKRTELADFLQQYPFYQYAADLWCIHAKNYFDDEEFIDIAKILFDPCKTTNFLCYIQWWRGERWGGHLEESAAVDEIFNIETLHIAACLYLYPVCEWLIKEKQFRIDVDKLSKIGTPLYCAMVGSDEIWYQPYPRENDPCLDDVGHGTSTYAKERTFNSLLDAGASMSCAQSHPDLDLTLLAVALRMDFGWEILCERGAMVDETCLDSVELLLDDEDYLPNEKAAKFMLKIGEENMPADKSRLVSLHQVFQFQGSQY